MIADTFLMGIAKFTIWAALGFGAYSVLFWRLAQAVHPVRLKLAREGETLLAEGSLSESDAADARQFLEHAYNGWVAPYFLIIMPISAVLLITSIIKGRPIDDEPPPSKDVTRLAWWFSISIFAANPFCGTLLALEFVALELIAVIATGSFLAARALARKFFQGWSGEGLLTRRAHS